MRIFRLLLIAVLLGLSMGVDMASAEFHRDEVQAQTIARLLEMHGPQQEESIRRGVRQMAELWREEDGSDEEFLAFALEHYLADERARKATFEHLEYSMEMLDGYLVSMGRELRHYMDEESGEIRPVDRLLASYNVGAHLGEDLFGSKIAFATVLNFPRTDLQQRIGEGDRWSREQWAQARLVDRFGDRVPADALQAVTTATSAADAYIADYNILMHHVLDDRGARLFPEGMRLITHWNLRDELKAQYGQPQGLQKQQLIAAILEAITRQSIPGVVIDNPKVDWKPSTGEVFQIGSDVPVDNRREADVRYEHLRKVFLAEREVDAFSPQLPTHIQRCFERDMELSEERVQQMLLALFEGPTAGKVAELISARLGRPLEPFDIWYAGFKPRAAYAEAELDVITRKRYPTARTFQEDIPRILKDLGFGDEEIDFLAAHIEVDPSRGAGHALGSGRRDDKAHLRTRVAEGGMDYKGYNIAIHELGHNVEQVFSLTGIDHTLLNGVPASAFTEAIAFVFQERDLQLLGLGQPSEMSAHLHALETFWATCEIGAVSLVDMALWRWMYEHPSATAAELREATLDIALQVWDQTFGPLMGGQPSVLLACYSHMLAYPLYLPNYPVGHIISFQLEEHFRHHEMAVEIEKACKQGRIAPDLWMNGAVGSPIRVQPLKQAAQKAVEAMK